MALHTGGARNSRGHCRERSFVATKRDSIAEPVPNNTSMEKLEPLSSFPKRLLEIGRAGCRENFLVRTLQEATILVLTASGMDNFLVKPIGLAGLDRALKRRVNRESGYGLQSVER